jgi:phage tail sheath protein FI
MWGQKTAQLKHSALDRINARRLVTYLEKSIEPALLPFVFQINNSTNRLRVWSLIDSFLSGVLAGGGLQGYNIICDDSNNTQQIINSNQLVVDCYVNPAAVAEFISLNVIITRNTGIQITVA